jgi:hypothetical protein
MGEFLFPEVAKSDTTVQQQNVTSDTVNQQKKCSDVNCEGSDMLAQPHRVTWFARLSLAVEPACFIKRITNRPTKQENYGAQ